MPGAWRAVGIEARFVQADVADTAAVLTVLAGDRFDVVFTSYGTISWIPDLRPWACTIAGTLNPGGVFFIADAHPFAWVFDDGLPEPALHFRYGYFDRNALRWDEKGSYAAPDPDFAGVSYSWQHTFEDIGGALIEAGLHITSLREYPYLAWRWFPWMVKDAEGYYRLPDGMPEIPLMFSLTATKPLMSPSDP